ncbi:alpha/beta fold hydrolase [bacterium]|nr:alpha/beta fold hydrolase [bacterium]
MSAANLPLRADALRTPESAFANLPGYPFAPHYADIDGYRVHYVDEGDRTAAPVLMLHGEPSWSYLYRKMIPPVAAAGRRVIAPDLIGFGKSDKPKEIATHTYEFHVEAIKQLVRELDLKDITLVCQDWGSLIGLRVAAEMPDRFSRIVLANGGLPTGEGAAQPQSAFMQWRNSVVEMQKAGDMPIMQVMNGIAGQNIGAAYAAPYPDKTYKAGPLAMPLLVPITPDDPASAANKRAWEVLSKWEKPFLTAFSDGDPITRGGDRIFQERVPGAKGQKHTTIVGAGHFLQEQKGEELAQVVIDFIKANP